MIWLKRLLPFVIIAAGIYAYVHYYQKKANEESTLDRQHALVTAQIWIASAKLRANPEEFTRVRDSLLAASSLSNEEVMDFVRVDSTQPERLSPFMAMVQEFVDSLLEIEDSIALATEDSLRIAGDTTR